MTRDAPKKPAGRRGPPGDAAPARSEGEPDEKKGNAAFNLWLQRGLHQLYDDVAREPIPDELMKLIEQDRDA